MQQNISRVVLLAIAIAVLQLSTGSMSLVAQPQDPEETIRVLEALVEELGEEIKGLNVELQKCDETSKSLEGEIELMQTNRQLIQENEKLLTQSMAAYGEIITIYGEGIKDRDKLIAELVKSSSKSTLRKIAETIPAVASIIAIALTAN